MKRMRLRTIRVGWSRVSGLLLLLALLSLRVADPGLIADLRLRAFDLFQQIKPREAVPQPVAIIDINDASIAELGQWPWPRDRIAEIVRRVADDGAVAIAFDIVFSEPDRLSPPRISEDNSSLPAGVRAELAALPDTDKTLARTFSLRPVILGQTSVRSATATPEQSRTLVDTPHATIGTDPSAFVPSFPDLVENLPALEAAAAGRGVFTVRPDRDGVYRRVMLLMRVEGAMRLSLSAELLRVATGGAPFAIRANEAGVDSIVVAGQAIRTEADGSVYPYLSPSDPSRFVSAADLLKGRMPDGRLNGHLVLIGTSAIGLEDFRAVPLGTAMAGVEIHAQVVENILTGSLLVRPNYAVAVELVTTAALGLLVIGLAPSLGAGWLIASSIGLLSTYAGGTYLAFSNGRLLIDPTFPLLSTGLLIMLITTNNYLREERERRQIRGAFGQYVSPQLVDVLQRNPDRLTLGGETRDLTILFTDVRGFTRISESFRENPSGLTALMNRMLTNLSDPILATGGTIDKFMGDAIMAFWNAPLPQDDHPAAACQAALDMQANIRAMNAQSDGAPLVVGIGVNTGAAVVGNMGSETRFDYT
ncbi:MAG: adenylate/guanylate cyclase domain-containing protein, partial [Pseudomonadota bacterium]